MKLVCTITVGEGIMKDMGCNIELKEKKSLRLERNLVISQAPPHP